MAIISDSYNNKSSDFCGKNVRHFLFIIGAASIMILIGTYYYKHYYSKGNGVVPIAGQGNTTNPAGQSNNQINAANNGNSPTAVQQNTNSTVNSLSSQSINDPLLTQTTPVVNNQPIQTQLGNNIAWNNNNTMTVAEVGNKILPNFAAVVDQMRTSVVNINTTRTTQTNADTTANNPGHQVQFSSPLTGTSVNSIGSGFIVSSTGHVLTNYHVIKNANGIFITTFMSDGTTQRYQGEVVKLDETKDLALLKINATRKFDAVILGDSSQIKTADSVIAIGSPYGLDQTVSRGIVSGIRKSLSIENVIHRNLIQTDAAINQGNSGGPLVDRYAHVIGINTAIYTPTGAFSGIGFAIPSNDIRSFVENEIKSNSLWSNFTGGVMNGLGMSVAAPGTPPTINANSTPPASHNDGRKQMVCSTCHKVVGGNNVAMTFNVAQGPAISANAPIPGNHRRDGRDKVPCQQCHQITGLKKKVTPVASTGNNGLMGLNVAQNAGPPININSRPPNSHKRDGRDKMQCKMCHQITGMPQNQVVAFATNDNQFAGPSAGLGLNIVQNQGGQDVQVANPAPAVPVQNSQNGTVTTMGLQIQPMNQAIINSLNNPLVDGVFVSTVEPNTPASRAGIKAGDIIFKLDGRWINEPQQLQRRLANYANSDNVRVGIYRDGQRLNRYMVISQTLAQIQQNAMNNAANQQAMGLPNEVNWNGMEVKPINDTLIMKEPQLASIKGGWVSDVDRASVAENAGIIKGDVILAINNVTVDNPETLFNIINNTSAQQQVLVKLLRNSQEIFITLN